MEDFRLFIKSRQKVNLTIVILNLVIFIFLNLIGSTESTSFMITHGAAYTPLILQGKEYYRLITSIFLHFTAQHIFYNMLLLIFLGDILEQAVGKIQYLMIYLGGGILGNLFSMYMEVRSSEYLLSGGRSAVVSAGASGAIFAVLGAVVWQVFKNRKRVNKRLIQRLIIMVVLSVAEGFTATGVDNYAHIGGLISGFLIAVLLSVIRQMQSNKGI